MMSFSHYFHESFVPSFSLSCLEKTSVDVDDSTFSFEPSKARLSEKPSKGSNTMKFQPGSHHQPFGH